MKAKLIVLTALRFVGGLAVLAASIASAQLVNGDFATGDLTGWCISNTVGPMTYYGVEQGGPAVAEVTLFDTKGTGTPINSAKFEVGQTAGQIGYGGPPAGIVFYQYVPLSGPRTHWTLRG